MRRFLAALLLAVEWAVVASAGDTFTVPTNGPALKLTVRTCFGAIGEYGYAPVVVTIANDTNSDLEWNFNFQDGYRFGGYGGKARRAERLAVAAGTTRQFPLLLPLTNTNGGAGDLNVLVDGPGVNPGTDVDLRSGPVYRDRPAVALTRSMGASIEQELKKNDSSGSGPKPVNGSLVETADLPTDWRGYTCIQAFYLSARELASLSAEQRAALIPWVQGGGTLILCEGTELPADFRNPGFGKVEMLPAKPSSETVRATAAALASRAEAGTIAETNMWALPKDIGTAKPNLLLLTLFLLGFGIVIGPVNLYILAPASRRARLFVTTPAIAIGASVVLLVGIVLKDGFGGSGLRQALVHLSPDHKSAITFQEQISRTGVLWTSSFRLTEPAVVQPMTLARTRRVADFENDTVNFAADWFAARSVQAQFVDSVTPTRGEVQLLSATPGEAAATPSVISTVEPALRSFFYRDPEGKLWAAEELPPGRRVALAPAAGEVPRFTETTARLEKAWDKVSQRNGYFFARIPQFPGVLETLPSVRWVDRKIFVCGPVIPAK